MSLRLRQDPPRYEMLQLGASSKNLQIDATFQGGTSACSQQVQEQKAYSLILTSEADAIRCKLVRRREGGMDEEWVDGFLCKLV